MENFDTTSTQYDGAINEYLDINKNNQFNLETTAIAASRVFAIPQNSEALALAKKNPSIIKMWELFQKNDELQKANIDQIIEVQKASHAFIQLINKRDMLQAAAIITVKNQLNTLNIENQEIYNTIKKLAGNVLDRFNQLERHIEHVEAVASLTQWIQNLKWRKYNEDPHTKRFFRILEDFYFKSGKNFTMQNLESLKTALDQSEINPFDTITIKDFTTTLVDELIEHDFNESMKHSAYNSKYSFDDINEKISLPFLSSLYLLSEEYNHLTKRRYPVDKIRDDIKQAALCYLKKDCGIDVEAQLEYYHLGIELLNGRRLIEFLDSPATTVTKESAKTSPSASPVEIDTSQERYKEYMDTVSTLTNDEETPGLIDDEEREMLKMKQKILKLTDEEAKKIEESVINNQQNKDEAERKYREEVKNALGDNPEITAKKRMRLDLSAQSFGISPGIAKKCEVDVIEEINTGLVKKVEDYQIIVREKLKGTDKISPKARIYLDLKIRELGLNKEIASKCEKEEINKMLLYKRDDRFIAYKNGTVFDIKTNLMWAANDNGSNIKWKDAKDYCETYSVGGYVDWRMPTENELSELFKNGKERPVASMANFDIQVATELIDITGVCVWYDEYQEADAFSFNFHSGMHETASRQSYEYNMRALPVRCCLADEISDDHKKFEKHESNIKISKEPNIKSDTINSVESSNVGLSNSTNVLSKPKDLREQLVEENKRESNVSQTSELSSSDNKKIRHYTCNKFSFDNLINGIVKWLENQKYNVQIINTVDGKKILQLSQGGFLRNVTGMSSALNVLFDHKEKKLVVEIGAGKWADKAAAGAVGMIVFAPLAITAGIGAWQQAKIPEKIFNYIDFQLTNGR